MKKICLIFVVLILCGCSSETKMYDEIGTSGYGVGWGGNPEGIVCEEIKDATYLTTNYFITNDGKIFKFHETKLFSNQKNCIEVPYDGDKIKFAFTDSLYNESNKKILAYDYDSASFLTEEEYKDKNGYTWNDSLAHVKVDYDFITQNDCDSEIIYIKGHDIYKYRYHYVDQTNEYVEDEPLFLGSIPKDEKIMYMADAMIKTNKNYYELARTNEEECNKYVDVKCTAGFVRSALSDIYDKLLFVSQDMVIDDQYRMYGKGSCFSIED